MVPWFGAQSSGILSVTPKHGKANDLAQCVYKGTIHFVLYFVVYIRVCVYIPLKVMKIFYKSSITLNLKWQLKNSENCNVISLMVVII